MKTENNFIVLYRWRLKSGYEEQFVAAWSKVTQLLLEQRGSKGSRLHQGSDGIWYSYAQWPSEQVRLAAFSDPVDSAASIMMRESIEESFPEVILTIHADFIL